MESNPAPFAFDGLDRLLHEKARLGLLTALATHPHGLVFTDLKALCRLTDGNLHRHLRPLQEAGIVEVWKGRKGKRQQTLVRLADDGRKRFLDYLRVLESVVADALRAVQSPR